MSTRTLVVMGAGGYGRSVAEAAAASSAYDVVGFLDDRWPDLEPIWGLPILGRTADLATLRKQASAAVIAIGNNSRRRAVFQLADAAGFDLISVVHPRAIISPSARVGRGVTIMAGAVIGCEVWLGDGVIVSAGAVVDHHGRLEDFSQVSAGASLGGGVSLGPEAWVQEGCALRPSEKIPAGTTVSTFVGNRDTAP